ncbi:MAG: prolipoprotein diacylglyceryl transferase [Synergistaceae bacterium]|jgi:phosphatidylglycerol:prolipoprotein diacylglycerol transferase|nr:prolipoprotein diacylglyceryl transferase [Synergistaceae bacterium]
MYPVLFSAGSIQIQTYYVIWFIALSLAMMWSVRRFRLYGVDEDEGRRVIGWAFLGMLFGARAFEYIWNFSAYWKTPSLFLDMDRGGLSEVGAFCGAFLTALLLCRNNPKISMGRLCSVVSLPAISTMAVGRWGCFFAGCCVGKVSSLPFAVHFPYDSAHVLRHATQLYYSFFSFAILMGLLWLERKAFRRKIAPSRSPVAPAGLLLYSLMRLSVDPLRTESGSEGLVLSHWILLATMPLEAVWLMKAMKE